MKNDPRALVLVTGGAKRVGAEIVRAFVRTGARVVIHYRDSKAEAEALLEEIGGKGKGHFLAEFDLSRPEGVPEFLKSLPEDLSVLVNNASVFVRTPFAEETPAEAERQFDVNFRSPAALMRELYGHSVCEELSVVNLLDQAISGVSRDSFSYLLSKKALAGATELAALQFAPRMRVNGISPGPVFPPAGLEHLKMEKTLGILPLKRAVSARDLAEAVVMLAFNRSITGSILNVDCGQHLV